MSKSYDSNVRRQLSGTSLPYTRPLFWILPILAFFLIIIPGFSSWYTVEQGFEAVVTRFGAAQYATGPGLHFKVPYIDGVTLIDTRELTNTEALEAGTSNRLPVVVKVSQTWRIKPGMTLDFFKAYGDRPRFESVILDPRMRETAKAALSKFDAVELLQQRPLISSEIDKMMSEDLKRYPVEIISSQIEDVQYPVDYMDAVREKEKAREAKEREQYELERQKLQAQQQVQTAEAAAEATRSAAAAEAERITQIGNAEAKAAQLMGDVLNRYPALIQHEWAKRWDGSMPQVVGGGAPFLMQLPAPSGRQ